MKVHVTIGDCIKIAALITWVGTMYACASWVFAE